MSQDFTTRLQHELRAAALREEERGPLSRLRLGLPRPAVLIAGAVAAALLIAFVLAGGLRWDGEQTITAPRVTTTFPVADTLGLISPGYGSVWAGDPAGRQVLRVDTDSRRVTARVPVGDDPAVNAGAGAVWAISFERDVDDNGELVRIDPASAEITARAPLRTPAGDPFLASDVQFADGEPWVLGASGALRIDAEDGTITGFVPIEKRADDPFPVWGAIAPDGLWMLRREQRLERYDLDRGRLAQLVPVRLAGTVAFEPTPAGLVLVTNRGELGLADRKTGRILWTQTLGTGITGVPMLIGDTLWTHVTDTGGGGDHLAAVDLATGKIRSQTRLPEFGAAGAAVVGERLWLATPTGKIMIVEPGEQPDG